MKFYLIVLLIWVAMSVGAFLHEGDIQRQCAENGNSGHASWRGELICSPKPK